MLQRNFSEGNLSGGKFACQRKKRTLTTTTRDDASFPGRPIDVHVFLSDSKSEKNNSVWSK